MRATCCRIPRTANTQIQELQVPSIIALQTSHTACLHCTCWRQQEEFIGAVKLADKNSSQPSHVQFGSILRMVSPQAHFSKWHKYSSVVLAPDRTIRRSPGSLHLEIVLQNNPCTVLNISTCSGPISVLYFIETAVPESSNSLVLHAPSSLSSLLALQSQSDLWIDTV